MFVPVRFILIIQITFTKQGRDAIQQVKLHLIDFMLYCVASFFRINHFRFFLNRSNCLPTKFPTSCFAEALIRLDGQAGLTKQSSSLQAVFTNKEHRWEKKINELYVFTVIKRLTITSRNVRVKTGTFLYSNLDYGQWMNKF